MNFSSFELAPGARLHILRETRFRRTHVTCFMSGPLEAETASPIALLPAVLVRGTARLPKAHLLEREMAALFGARMGAGVGKSGDRQIVRVGLNLSDEKYAGAQVLGPGLDFLRDIVTNPWLPGPGGSFDGEYVEQEKRQLVGRIKAIINNKVRYAMQQGIQQIFKGEPAALSEEGTVEGAEAVTPESLVKEYRRMLSTYQMDVYIIGDVDPQATVNLAGERLRLSELQGRNPVERTKSIVAKGEGEMTRIFTKEPMEQGWIILGVKSGIPMGAADRWTLAVANGILGGFPHSKLFVNVREKASLAYTAASFSDATKGVVIAYAGIDPSNYQKASDLMLAQLAEVAKGEFGDDELESTKEAMITDLRLQLDSPGYLIYTHYAASSEGTYEDVPSSIEAVRRVTRDDVVRVASQLRTDTMLFLSSLGREDIMKG